jgi:kumamolisin
MTTIDIAQIRTLAPRPIDQYNKAFSAANVATILDTYGISKTPLRVCHFMAQVLTETGRLRVLVESLDYTATRLRQVWPTRFTNAEIAEQYAHDEEKLGDYVYANRLGNGDATSGDGFNYRGRGLLQITGKAAYARFGKQLGINSLVTNPDLAFDPEWCLAIAAAEWAVSGYGHRFCNELADQDDIYGVTHAINGGLTGIDDRITWLKRCKAIWLPAPSLASRAASQADEQAAKSEATGAVSDYVQRPGAPRAAPPTSAPPPSPPQGCVPYFKRPRRTLASRVPSNARPFDIGDLCKAYSWPKNQPGGGTIAIVELDGGYTPDDMTGFFQKIRQPEAVVTHVSIDGAKNNPNLHLGEDNDPDIEVTMDIQVAAAAYSIATGKPANIRVYWAPNQPGAIAKAVRQAIRDGCDTCSISWGADEGIWKGWTTSDIDYVEDMENAASEAAKAGMIVFAASGDNDARDGGSDPANVDVPSSCPSVIGCGGTTKTRNAEIVWNNDPGKSDGEGTGGGYSDYFAPPAWQARAPQIGQDPPRRMVPDVAANADPNTGYNLVVHGKYTNYGGTSAVAPLYAGLFAALGRKLAPIAATIWNHEECFTDIVSGDNGEYHAAPGPDPCTGLGVPIGAKLAALLANQTAVNQDMQQREVPPAFAGVVPAAPFDPVTATEYGLFVEAAYSMYAADPNNLIPEPTSNFPAGFRLAAWVQMQDFIILSTGPTFYGFLAQNIANPMQFVLAIRGTQTPEEWWDDFTSIIKTPFSAPNCGSVALGFNRIYQTMEIVERPTGAAGAATAVRSLKPVGSFATQAASLVRRLSQAASPRAAGVLAAASISVVGHSLGSALATLYTMENAKGDQIRNPILCTFASPRVGDANFVAAFSALPLTSWRIVNEPDIVPTQPPELAGFRHIGVEQKFDSSASAKASLVCWHAMATYLSLVDPARKPDPACLVDTVPSAVVGAEAAMAPADAGVTNDGSKIANLLRVASDPTQLQAAQATAAKRLLTYDGEQYPSDGCAITLSVLLQESGINVPDTFQAIVLGRLLAKRGWKQIPLGSQAAGDIGSTCFQTPHHGTDHIYLVLRPVNADEMVIADNQATEPHFRFASGKGKSPTQFFLRAPKAGA